MLLKEFIEFMRKGSVTNSNYRFSIMQDETPVKTFRMVRGIDMNRSYLAFCDQTVIDWEMYHGVDDEININVYI